MESSRYPAGDPAWSSSPAQFLARELALHLCAPPSRPYSAMPGAEHARVNGIPLSAEQGARFAARLELEILQHLDRNPGPALVGYQGAPTPILRAAIDAADATSHRLEQGPLAMWSYRVFTDRLMHRSHNPALDGSWRVIWPSTRVDPDFEQLAALRAWDVAWQWARTITGWHRAAHPSVWSPFTDDQAAAAAVILAMSIRHAAGQQQPASVDPVDEARVSFAHLPIGYPEAEQAMAAPLAAIVANLADPAATDELLAAGNRPPEMHARDRHDGLQAWQPGDRHQVVVLALHAVATLHAAGPIDATLASRSGPLGAWIAAQ